MCHCLVTIRSWQPYNQLYDVSTCTMRKTIEADMIRRVDTYTTLLSGIV